MLSGLSSTVLILLVVFGLVGGIGITALGPGGVLPTIGLFTLTELTPAEVAGTAIVTHIATGILGTAVYIRSGQLQQPETRRATLLLAATALLGTPLGVAINTVVSQRIFGILLGGLVAVVAALMWYRERSDSPSTRTHPSVPLIAAVGFSVAVASGIIGIGGPMLTVPLLIALRVPVLESLASAQAQSIIIASVGTVGYLAHDAINWPLAALIGIPELIGVVLGWKIAQTLPTRTLKYTLIVTLLALAPYLALRG